MLAASKVLGSTDIWTNWVLSDTQEAESAGFNFIVCDDLRFTCQADFLRNENFLLVRLDTTPELISSRDQGGKTTGNDSHPSETDLDNYSLWDIQLMPNVTIDHIVEVVWLHLQKRGLLQ